MPDSNRSPARDDSVAAAGAQAHPAVVPLMEERVEVGTVTTPAGTVRVRIEIDEGRERFMSFALGYTRGLLQAAGVWSTQPRN